MSHPSSLLRRVFMTAAVLIASTAALAFSQGASATKSGHSSDSGVLVISVPSGSPADNAGLSRGDIILDINGSAVNSTRDLREAISSYKQGDKISLAVLHGDTRKTLSISLGEMDGNPYLGARLLPDERERTSMLGPGHVDWSRELSEGAFVAGVASTSPAYKGGIRRGDVILSVDGVRVDRNHSLNALIQDNKTAETVTLSVRSNQEPMYQAPEDMKITLGNSPDKKPWLGVKYRMGNPTAFVAPWSSFPQVANLLKDLGILRIPRPTV